MKELTKKQEEVYCYIAGFITDNGYSPTRFEISENTGNISTQSVDDNVKNLAKKGWIKFNGKKFRNIELIPK